MEDAYSDAPNFDLNLGKTVNPRTLRLKEQRELTFTRRGMGKTGISHRAMTDAERISIFMLHSEGYSYEEIGEKVSRSANTVRGIVFKAKKEAIAAGMKLNWREDLKERSIVAVRAGLDHDKDPYKRAGVGIQTLKGLGEFETEGQVHIAQLLNSIPEGQRDRYVSLDTSDAIEIEGVEVPSPAPDAIPSKDEPEAEPEVEIPEPEGDSAP
jgi:hypothetical protein